MQTTITLRSDAHAKCWLATFRGSAVMPEGVPLPLPFTPDAPLAMVRANLARRFPKAKFVIQVPNEWL